ncbi:hypothetical protein Bra3105_18275 [Brachybacterium halotolerans subsp. kimchii]|uniref:hypothetical protein n=1 Tax=Brachybacterium halotolerans TaxID=2795215 RepID=UPI001E312DFB|nr:hypothetical protein [Brachybacterium halotolerans]UEJ82745.1 hypothetical protein Bra3105_18275 [Brachybacterium halotolerans subsp. kimchii]
MRASLDAAWERQIRWDLPDLDGPTERAVIMGTLVRDRALTLILEELVGAAARRRRRAPWGDLWAGPWFENVVLVEARTRTTEGWWTRRAPRTGWSWAIALDPEGAGAAGWV